MSQTIVVGISDLKVAKNPDILVTYALGSCVGICLIDPALKVGGLSHIMLPLSEGNRDPKLMMRYADTGIVMLVNQMLREGCKQERMQAKIAGGAQMFKTMQPSLISNVGDRNIQATKAVLAHLKIPILAEDCGKDYGRTLFFSPANGMMQIKSIKSGKQFL